MQICGPKIMQIGSQIKWHTKNTMYGSICYGYKIFKIFFEYGTNFVLLDNFLNYLKMCELFGYIIAIMH